MGKLADLRRHEEAEAEGLAEKAQALGTLALQPATLIAARLAVQAVQRDDRRGSVGEPAADLSHLRTDHRLMPQLEGDLQRAQASAFGLIIEAIRKGYEIDARGRAAITEEEATGLRLTVEITPQDLRDLASYPILGHAPREIARHLADTLRYEVDGALAMPLTGTIDPAAIAPALGDVARKHGDRLANAVREAFFAGTQAATKAITAALTGAA